MMVNTTTKTYGAIGLPTIDYYALSPAEINAVQTKINSAPAAALKDTLHQLSHAPNADDVTHYIASIIQSSESTTDTAAIIIENATNALSTVENFCQTITKSKITLAPEQQESITTAFTHMRAAARLGEEFGIDITVRHTGGTACNKLLAIARGRGNGIDGELFGLVGNDIPGNLIEERLAQDRANGINIQLVHGDTAQTMQRTKESFIFVTDDDRKILKMPAADKLPDGSDKAVSDMLDKQAVISAVKSWDTLLLEGSAINSGKFGTDLFTTVVDTAIESGSQIIFSPPTDTSLPELHPELFNRIIDYAGTTMLTMNEEEAVAMFNVGAVDNMQPTLEAIQARLASKPSPMTVSDSTPNVEPIAVISNGSAGAWVITPSLVTYQAGRSADPFIDSTGAGDNFAAGAIIARNTIMTQKRAQTPHDLITFTESELQDILTTAQNMGRAAVEKKGAQLPQETILQALAVEPPHEGEAANPPQQPSPTTNIEK